MSAGSACLRDLLSRFNLRGKGAIITGAAGAFGRACALTLGALGGKLVLISGSDRELQAVKAGVQAVGGEVVTLVRCPD